jgi:hypothetical protein
MELLSLYGYETWSLTLKEKCMTVFENRLLSRVFVWKTERVTGVWKRMMYGELHNLHSSPDIIRVIKSRRVR